MCSKLQPIDFESGVRAENYEYLWKIKNFKMLLKDPDLLTEQTLPIQTINGSQMSSKWTVSLKKFSDVKRRLSFYLVCNEMLKNGNKHSDFSFHCRIELKCRYGKEVKSYGEIQERCQSSSGSWSFRLTLPDSPMKSAMDSTGTVYLFVRLSLLSSVNDSLTSQLSSLFLNEAQKNLNELFSLDSIGFDMEIICSDRNTIRCHKKLLAVSSPVFKSMFESDLSEAKTGRVKLADISGKTMGVFVHFLYTGRLQEAWYDPGVILEFIYAAGKYQMTSLLEFIDKTLGNLNEDYDAALLTALIDLTGKLSLKKAEEELKAQITRVTLSAKTRSDILNIFRNF